MKREEIPKDPPEVFGTTDPDGLDKNFSKIDDGINDESREEFKVATNALPDGLKGIYPEGQVPHNVTDLDAIKVDNPDAVEAVAPAEEPVVASPDITIEAQEAVADDTSTSESAVTVPAVAEPTPKPVSGEVIVTEHISPASDEAESTHESAEETPKGRKDKLRELIRKAKGKLYSAQQRIDSTVEGTSEKYGRMKNYLNNRVAELDSKSVEMSGMEEWFRNLGQKYNKLGFKSKIAIGISLGAGASAFAGVSVPVAIAFATGLGVQRFLGMAGAFLKFERDWSAKESGKFIAKKEKAILKAAAYSLLMGYGIMKGVEVASESSYGGAVQEWLRAHWPFADTTRPSAPENAAKVEPATNQAPSSFSKMSPDGVVPPNPDTSVTPVTQASVEPQPATTTAQETVKMPEVTVNAIPEISVEATKGKGYEFMLKRVWEQLQEKNLDPNNYPIGSDIRRLLEADQQSIDRIVHKIAADPKHNFFHADGTSVRIDLDAKMSINSSGDIELGGNVRAPDDAPVTPSYNVEQAPTTSETNSQSGVYEVPEIPVDTDVLKSPESLPDAQPTTGAEEIKPYTNEKGVLIDPKTTHIYSDDRGAVYAFGNNNNYKERLEVAKGYVLANPKASVWVQADKPMLIGGESRQWVVEVKNGGFFRGVQVLDHGDVPDKSRIGLISPKIFTKQLDV